MHAAYAAVRAKAQEIIVLIPGKSRPIRVFPVAPTGEGRKSPAIPAWYRATADVDAGISLSFISPAPDVGHWPESVLKENPIGLEHAESLVATGKGAVWMYAAAGAEAARAGIPVVLYDSPREPFLICVGKEKPGMTVPRKTFQAEPGVVVGIVGDPNSGKSMLAKALYSVLCGEFPSGWLMDCDAASPTPNWYLQMVRCGKEGEGRMLREAHKRQWSAELEGLVAAQLQSLKRNLPVVVADLPGGKHPKHGEGFSVERIPSGREVVMREVDLFIILGRRDHPDIVGKWREELARHGLANRIIAELESDDHKAKPELSLAQGDGLTIKGRISGLDRATDPAKILDGIRSSCGEIVRHIRYWRLAGVARAATAKVAKTSRPSPAR